MATFRTRDQIIAQMARYCAPAFDQLTMKEPGYELRISVDTQEMYDLLEVAKQFLGVHHGKSIMQIQRDIALREGTLLHQAYCHAHCRHDCTCGYATQSAEDRQRLMRDLAQ